MTTLHSSIGPNPSLVRMFLIEKGIVEGTNPGEIALRRYDILSGENRRDERYLERNPLGTTPMLELDDGTCLTESWPICEFIEEQHPKPNLFGNTPAERAEVRKWARLFDQEVVVPMTMGFRGGPARAMFEPRLRVVSPQAAAELSAYADEKWRWFDAALGSENHFALGRITFADLLVFCFAKFGLTTGWSLPEGTRNLARFVDRHNGRESARVWHESN